MSRDVTIKKQVFTTLLLGTILILPLMTVALTPVTVSSLQFGKLQDKPDSAGNHGGHNDGDGDGETTTTYVLDIEIDYMEGHEPTNEVLDYVVGYYAARGIEVTFYADGYLGGDEISEEVPLVLEGKWNASDGISDEEFEAIEAVYNDNDYGYFDNWKWVLFGTTVYGEPNVIGHIHVSFAQINPKKADVLAGNYILIADETADEWATTTTLEIGAEATVLMHEIGHSIGIGKVEWNVFNGWVEVYDRDTYGVMSYLNVNNAGYYNQWYYSDKYWNTRNMEYYEVTVA